jgi:3',5'-cyclic AMP phosphodiesterase CpdA
VVYYPPTSADDGVLADLDDEDIVGILGDWGTNMHDAFDIMDELVLKRGVTVLLHDGDVYYAGFPDEFLLITKHLAELRKKVHNLRYYAIPGNHDYYTFGGPFYASLPTNNDPKNPEWKQTASFFCIKNKSSTVQFIGVNTGLYDHQFVNVINPWWQGPQVDPAEVAWAIQKINSFPGQTFLISHHPLFSTFDKAIGQWTEMGHKNRNVNPTLASQFF